MITPRPLLRKILSEELKQVKKKSKDTRKLRGLVRETLLLQESQTVKAIQELIGEFTKDEDGEWEDDKEPDGKWTSSGTDPAWYAHIRDEWDEDAHGDINLRNAILDDKYGWADAYEFFNAATGKSVRPNPRGALEFLQWMVDPDPPAEEGHAPDDAREPDQSRGGRREERQSRRRDRREDRQERRQERRSERQGRREERREDRQERREDRREERGERRDSRKSAREERRERRRGRRRGDDEEEYEEESAEDEEGSW